MSGPREHLLVLQFPGSSIGDFDRLVALEEVLAQGLGPAAEVDGHDIGSGEGNIFVFSDDAPAVFRDVLRVLDDRARTDLRAAYREAEGEPYTILWPSTLKTFRVL
jgi:hypothetical protein